MKKSFIILFILLSCSCSLDGFRKNRDFLLPEMLTKDQILNKSIVLTRVNAQSACIGAIGARYGSGFTEMNWCKDSENKDCREVFYMSPYIKKRLYSEPRGYLIMPGKYYLHKIKESQDYTEDLWLVPFKFLGDAGTYGVFIKNNFNTSLPGWNEKLRAQNYASFEANAGEIVYIGDLIFTFTKHKYWPRGKVNLVVEDRYDEAVRYFYEKHPEFKNKKVIKRLVQPGVMLDNFKGGFFW